MHAHTPPGPDTVMRHRVETGTAQQQTGPNPALYARVVGVTTEVGGHSASPVGGIPGREVVTAAPMGRNWAAAGHPGVTQGSPRGL